MRQCVNSLWLINFLLSPFTKDSILNIPIKRIYDKREFNYAAHSNNTRQYGKRGFISLHGALCSLFNYTHHHVHTHIYIYIYIYTHTHTHTLFKKSKIYIKTFKTLLHVSDHTIILREHILFLAKVIIKTFSELLLYVNFGAVAAYRVFVCESYAV